jgi:hypothetical protein
LIAHGKSAKERRAYWPEKGTGELIEINNMMDVPMWQCNFCASNASSDGQSRRLMD